MDSGVGDTYGVAVTVGATAAVLVGAAVGGGGVGVEAAASGYDPFGVMVGTGEESAAWSVPTRSTGLPEAGISVMIWSNIFWLIGGIDWARGSAL